MPINEGGVTELISNGNTDLFVRKLDKDGNMVWVKSFGGSGYDYVYHIEVDNAENLCITGFFSDTVDLIQEQEYQT